MNATLLQTIRSVLRANGFEAETNDRFVNARWTVEILPCSKRTVVFCFDSTTNRARAAELSTVDDAAALMYCNTRTWTKRSSTTKVDAVHALLRDVAAQDVATRDVTLRH